MITIFGKSFLYEKFLKKNNITVISHSSYVGKNSYAKSFPWFPDFQEYFLPRNFNKKSIFLRKLNLFLATHHSEKILVSSKSTLKDLKKFPIHLLKKQKFYFIQINFFLILKYYLKKN